MGWRSTHIPLPSAPSCRCSRRDCSFPSPCRATWSSRPKSSAHQYTRPQVMPHYGASPACCACSACRRWHRACSARPEQGRNPDRKSVVSGKNVEVRVDRGGRRLIEKKYQRRTHHLTSHQHVRQKKKTKLTNP